MEGAGWGGGGLTVELEALADVPAVVFAEEELEVVVGVVDGADFVDIVDEVALDGQVSTSRVAVCQAGDERVRLSVPELLKVRHKDRVSREARPVTAKHGRLMLNVGVEDQFGQEEEGFDDLRERESS